MTLFKFEDDFVQSLRCIPMQVRLKLDTCGVKLKLDHWNELSLNERSALVDMPCETKMEANAYRVHLQELVVRYTGEPAKALEINPHPPWLDATAIPPAVKDKAQSLDISITPDQWAKLTILQRFALIKLSRPSHENSNFLPAAQEFNLGLGHFCCPTKRRATKMPSSKWRPPYNYTEGLRWTKNGIADNSANSPKARNSGSNPFPLHASRPVTPNQV